MYLFDTSIFYRNNFNGKSLIRLLEHIEEGSDNLFSTDIRGVQRNIYQYLIGDITYIAQ